MFDAPWRAQGCRGESEHQVYFDVDRQRWIKRNTLNFHDGSIGDYLDRLAIQKLLFPDVAPILEGFTEHEGQIVPIISQPHAAGDGAREEQVVAVLWRLGFIEVFETGRGMGRAYELAVRAGLNPPPPPPPRRIGFLHPENGIWVEDIHGENAVREVGGVLQVFDPVAFLVRPDEVIEDSVPC